MDDISSVLSEEYVEAYRRKDKQHTYRCHDKIEVYQMFG